MPLVEEVCRTVSEDELSHFRLFTKTLRVMKKSWDCTNGYVESIWTYIPVVLGIILKHIGKFGKMKIVTQ